MDILLKVSNLSLWLKSEKRLFPILDDLSFELKKGQTLALVGESGCGKSMTALSILHLLPQSTTLQGEILYQGLDLLKLKEKEMRKIRGKKIAMIFQDPQSTLNPVYTIGEQLKEVATTHLDLQEEGADYLVIKALEQVHLPTPKKIMPLYPHQLSGGMLQRVMIAMALICSPDILIADEPTTALDVTIQLQILNLLKELQEKTGMATLLITHDMGVVAHNADHVIVMYAGHHVETGSVKALFECPSHPYTQALFASRPNHMDKKKLLSAIPGFVPRITDLPPGCPFHPRCPHVQAQCKIEKIPFIALGEGHLTKCLLHNAK